MGMIFPILTMVVIGVVDPGFDEILPSWFFVLAFFGTFWFQTMDAVDGKQARRIDNCSPMGQILDHSLDQITATSVMLHVCATLMLNDVYRILLIVPGVMSAHFSIEYRTHFTNFHNTVVGFIGATEQLIFIQIGTLLPCFVQSGNAFYRLPLELPFKIPFLEGIPLYAADVVVLFSAITGFHYNLENIIIGIWNAKGTWTEKGKVFALCATLPYIQFILMIWFSSYSVWWNKYPMLFLLNAGMFLTWVNGIFNLASTADLKFDWKFIQPFFYLLALALDYHEVIDA